MCRIFQIAERKSLFRCASRQMSFAQKRVCILIVGERLFLECCRSVSVLVVDERTGSRGEKINSRTYESTRRSSDEEFASRGAKFTQNRTNTLDLESEENVS